MKTISIPVKKTVTETVELPQLPYYSCAFGCIYYMIAEDQTVIQVTAKQIVFWRPNDAYYGEHLVEAYQADECDKKDFDASLAATNESINIALNPAKGAVTNTMEPNNKQQEEQVSNDVQPATEQVAATESAAQDQAMGVDAEEGTTEG